nr:unnamed protein product [Naegleria fowleri]
MNSFCVLSVSIAEFDKLCGNSLTHTYPRDVHLEKYYPTLNIADKCIPDGGHIYSEDQTGIILPISEDKSELIQALQKYVPSFKTSTTPLSPKTPSLTVGNDNIPVIQQPAGQYLYGSVLFRNKLDDRVKRGAIQKSILVVTTKPLFTLFTPLMRDAIERIINAEEEYIQTSDPTELEKKVEKTYVILKELYESLKVSIDVASSTFTKKLTITFNDKQYALKVPKSKEDTYNGASLIDFITIFEKHICYIWEALLLSRRILFVGSPAKIVTMCCLSCPLLIQPMKGITNRISPYVTIGDPKLSEIVYVCGMTNPILENSKTSWDYYASIAAGKVLYKKQKMSLVAKSEFTTFIKQVLSGIKKGKSESWVREQFNQFNLNFLKTVPTSKKKIISQVFIYSNLYRRFCSSSMPVSPITPTSPGVDMYGNSMYNNVRTFAKVGLNLDGSESPLKVLSPKLVKDKHSRSSSGELTKKSPRKSALKTIYRKLNPFISTKDESSTFSHKELIPLVISDVELEFLWPYIMPNSESMLDWSITGHVTLYNMTLCIKDGLNTFYSRHNGPLSHRYEKVLANIHYVLGQLFKESDGTNIIYSQELLESLDRKTLQEREKSLLDTTTKNKRDCSFVHVKFERPIEAEFLVINSEVKQTSQRSLFVHKIVRLHLQDNNKYIFSDNPEYVVYVVNRMSDEQTELTQVHVIKATNLSEKRDKYMYYNPAIETRKLLMDRLNEDVTDYTNFNTSDSESDDNDSEDEDMSL